MAGRLGFARTMMIATLMVALFLVPNIATATDNSGCLNCHAGVVGSVPAQGFAVGDVDRNTACVACHSASMVGSHPYHQAGSNCGAYCHPGWGASLLTATPSYTDPASGATFASATSKATPASVLHIIHSTARWPKNIDTKKSRCASCHSVAACSACHQSATSARHASHSSTTQTKWSGTTGYGVVGGNQTIYSAGPESNLCAASGCHSIAATQGNSPLSRENFSHPAGGGMLANTVALTPSASAWPERYSPLYSLGRMSLSNVTNATHTTTFVGQRFQLIADRDPYRGIGEVWLDGVKVATVDFYAPTTTNQAVVYESATLAAGSHTVMLKVTGTKNPASRFTYVTMDCLKVYTSLPDSIAPSCARSGCHSDKVSNHGGSFDHEATQTAGLYPTGRFDCTDCHSLGMWTEHGRTSSKTAAAACTACHTTYADYSLDEFSNPARTGYGSCTWAGDGSVTGCHQVASSEQPHNFIDSNHDASTVAATADCRACHGNDLSVIHDDTNAARPMHTSLVGIGSAGPDYQTDCLTCHGPNKFPTTKDCTDSGCHIGSGVVDMASHPAPAHNGTNSNAGVPRTGGELCSTCHILELTGEHGKPSSVTSPGGGAIDCADCHSAAYFPAGWLDAPNTTNTCNACHNPAGAADAGLPHESAEYASKHNWSATSAGCGGFLCHTVSMIDTIHRAVLPYDSSCRSCHTSSVVVPTVDACTDCHVAHPYNGIVHDPVGTPARVAANADCLTCHTEQLASVTAYHTGGCFGCHNNPNKLIHYLQDNYDLICTDCHNATMEIGWGQVKPYYDYTFTSKAPTYESAHYDIYAASHTATGMGAAIANKTCSNCHATTLKVEHLYTLSAGVVECFECHTMSAPINAKSVIAADWQNDACGDCHGSNHGAAGLATHNLAASATSLGCSAGGCHSANTDDIATLHLAAVDGGSNTSCNVCHTNADTDLSAIAGCDDCHAGHNLTVHEVSTDTGNCLRCHDEGAPAADLRGLHPTCDTCHNNATYPGITTGKTSDCVDCHAAGLVAEPHNDPNGNYSPYDANHYNGTEATHTADGADTGYANTDGNSCVSCHLLEMKPEHFKGSSAFASVPGTYADRCVACHEINVDGFVGAWTDRCVACHTTGSSHTGFDTVHNAPASYDTSCGGGGCHDTDNVDLIHKNSVASNATVTTCLNTCHDTNTAVPASVSCDTAGCHAGVTAHSHDLSVAGSNYNNTTQTGCTNSGAGCHGTDSAADYSVAQYHPTASSTCLTSACHTASNKNNAQFDNPNTCQNCHGGGALLFDGAPDAVGLADASPAGHYGEALHAAGAMSATISSGGSATATCASCHNPVSAGIDNLYAQHLATSSGSLTCSGCHNANVSVTAVVTGSWPTKACNACHASGTLTGFEQHGALAPVVNATSTNSCGATGTNCHSSYDVHALHKNASGGCNLSGCHDYTKQGIKPTATTCGQAGGCHAAYTVNTHLHATDAVKHQPTTLAQANATTFYATACGACHDIRNSGSSLTLEHALSTSAKTTNATNVCRNCHNNSASTSAIGDNWSTKDTTTACSTCHTGAMAIHADSNSTAHSDELSSGCSSSGAGCHNSSDLSKVGVTNVVNDNIHANCLRCHDRTATAPNLAFNPANDTCGSGRECHAVAGQYNATTLIHNGSGGLANGGDTAHHTASATQMTSMWYGTPETRCNLCHLGALDAEHTRATSTLTGAGSTLCEKCHNDSATVSGVVKSSWTAGTCTVCHANNDGTSAQFPHVDMSFAHTSGTSVIGCTGLGAGCHGTAASADLRTVHVGAGCALTRACHSTTLYNPGVKTCTSALCHPSANYNTTTYAHNAVNGTDVTHQVTGASMTLTVGAGGSATATCSACHSDTLKPAHNRAVGYATASLGWTNECTGCHNATTPINVAALVAANNWTDSCTGNGCHTTTQGAHVDGGVADAPVVTGTTTVVPSCATAGCHVSMDLHALHKNSAVGCGGTDAGGSGCHNAANKDRLPTAKSCGSGGLCHNTVPTHLNEAAKHTSTASQACVDCHESADTKTVHAGSSKGACAVCHNHPTLGNVAAGKNAECVTCHNAAGVGTTDYTGRTGSSAHYSKKLANHLSAGNGNETGSIVTPGGWGTNNYTYACSQCHDMTMWTEHALATASFANVPGTYADKCVACHESKVDTLGVWNDTCVACHTGATARHLNLTTAHNASALGTPSTNIGVFSDTFETNNLTAGGWTNLNWQATNADKYAGTYSARNVSTTSAVERNITKNVDLSTYADGSLTFWYKTSTLAGGTDYLRVYTATAVGGPYTQQWARTTTNATWTQVTLALPAQNLWIRFGSSTNLAAEYVYVDNVAVTANTIATGPVASCGTPTSDCHDVSDVRKLHAYDLNNDGDRADAGEAKCQACHVSAAARATTLNCTTAGCHGAGAFWYSNANETNHRAYHNVTTAATADGSTIGRAAAEVDTQCTGCHEPMLDSDHWYLSLASGAFDGNTTKAKNCAPCHYKTANSVKGTASAVTNVTALNTRIAISTDRHNCTVCHTSTTWTSTFVKMHESRGNTNSFPNNTEFNNTYSGHRAFSFMPGVVKTWTAGGASNVAWGWTGTMDARVFKTAALQPGNRTLNSTTMIYCDDCHDYTGATGPHGAAMTISLEAGYNNTYSTGALYIDGSANTWNDGGAANVPICEKCHLTTVKTYNSEVHNRSDHWGNAAGSKSGICTVCHSPIPHAWKRPRLLAYTTDTAPYASTRLTGVSNRTHNDGASWTAGDCSTSGCDTHSTSGTPSNGLKFP